MAGTTLEPAPEPLTLALPLPDGPADASAAAEAAEASSEASSTSSSDTDEQGGQSDVKAADNHAAGGSHGQAGNAAGGSGHGATNPADQNPVGAGDTADDDTDDVGARRPPTTRPWAVPPRVARRPAARPWWPDDRRPDHRWRHRQARLTASGASPRTASAHP